MSLLRLYLKRNILEKLVKFVFLSTRFASALTVSFIVSFADNKFGFLWEVPFYSAPPCPESFRRDDLFIQLKHE